MKVLPHLFIVRFRRLMARTPGCLPENEGSIPFETAIKFIGKWTKGESLGLDPRHRAGSIPAFPTISIRLVIPRWQRKYVQTVFRAGSTPVPATMPM